MVGVVRGVAFVVFQRHLRDEAAFLVDVQAAVGAAVAVVLHGFNAAVLAVPDGFAGGVVAVEVVRVAAGFQDEGRGLRFAAVLVVVLHDLAAIAGASQRLAVVAACAGLVDRAAVGREVPGFFVAGGVIQGDFRRLSGIQQVFRQGGGHARRGGEFVDGDFGLFGLRRFGWRRLRRFGVDDGGGKAEGEQDDGDLDHVGSPFGGRGIIAGLYAVAMMIR